MDQPLIFAPDDTSAQTYSTLGYVDAYDVPLNCDYAFVAYKETDVDSGAWRVRIRSSQTAGGVFEPEQMRLKCREADANGVEFFLWGYNFEPSDSDPRQIEFRVYPSGNRPSRIEIFVRLRKADNSAGKEKSITFDWPAS